MLPILKYWHTVLEFSDVSKQMVQVGLLYPDAHYLSEGREKPAELLQASREAPIKLHPNTIAN